MSLKYWLSENNNTQQHPQWVTQRKPIGSLKRRVVTLGPYVSPASGWPWETEGSSLIHVSMISAKNNRLTQAGLNRNVSPHKTASPGDRVAGFSDAATNLVLPFPSPFSFGHHTLVTIWLPKATSFHFHSTPISNGREGGKAFFQIVTDKPCTSVRLDQEGFKSPPGPVAFTRLKHALIGSD